MKRILIITPSPFHDKIGHAGGKTINYYTKQLSKDFLVDVLCTSDINNDVRKMVEENDNLNFILFNKNKRILDRVKDNILFSYIYKCLKLFFPFYFISNGFYKRRLQYLLVNIKQPECVDVVIVEYTQLIVHINVIKSFLPNAKYFASCHDITFQSVERRLEYENKILIKHFYVKCFKNLEKKCLLKFDTILVQNFKDKNLLQTELEILESRIHIIVPSYDTYLLTPAYSNNLVFLGYMKRAENMEAVIWFLQNVWCKLKQRIDKELKLFIIGGGLSKDFILLEEKYEDIKFTGFVSDPTYYFNHAYAMIIPLQTGAGIKVKTIEGLASGIPIISNNIGVEGIPVRNKIDYLHCENANEWITTLTNLIYDEKLRNNLISNSQKLVIEQFNLKDSYMKYKERIIITMNSK